VLVLCRTPAPENADAETMKRSSIRIGDDIVVTVVSVTGNKVRLGVTADPSIPVHRQEIFDVVQASKERFAPPMKDSE
jgi:carbon storage regulator